MSPILKLIARRGQFRTYCTTGQQFHSQRYYKLTTFTINKYNVKVNLSHEVAAKVTHGVHGPSEQMIPFITENRGAN